MADGTRKAIEEIEVGDEVIATDPETGEQAAKTVTYVWVHDDTLVDLEVDGTTITTTEDHPFWNASEQEFQDAAAIDPGDSVLTVDGHLLPVGGIDMASAYEGLAYNLTVADIHTYYVLAGDAPVLVHNSNGLCGVGDFRGGDTFYHSMPTAKGDVEMLAGVRIDGSKLHLSDVAVYGTGDMTRGALDSSAVLRELRSVIAPAAAQQGFTELRITAIRLTGNVGHEVDMTLDLSRYAQ
jgi:hypothetical protein